MKLVSYGLRGMERPGVDIGGAIADAALAARFAGFSAERAQSLASTRRLLTEGAEAAKRVCQAAEEHRDALRRAGGLHEMSSVRLGPPITDPEKIICIGLNYYDHAEEVGAEPPGRPIFFAKYPTSLAGPTDPIAPPRETDKLDYEAELAIVIGRAGRRISEPNALGHIAGVMAFNDVSARDLQLADQLWTGGKAVDGFAPCGPALVLAPDYGDLNALQLRTLVNGDVVQDGSTSRMIHSIPKIIAFLSRIMTLSPGDIIATGTPAGVAGAHSPPRFLKTGDVVEVAIDGVGALKNPIAEPI